MKDQHKTQIRAEQVGGSIVDDDDLEAVLRAIDTTVDKTVYNVSV
jgi:hypothetical protein